MNVYQTQFLAIVENSITDFGNSTQITLWQTWTHSSPFLDDPLYGAPELVCLAILESLGKRAEFLRHQVKAPALSQAEIDYLRSLLASVDALIEKISENANQTIDR